MSDALTQFGVYHMLSLIKKRLAQRKALSHLPSPAQRLLVGNMLQLLKSLKKNSLPSLFHSWQTECGDIFVIWHFWRPEILIYEAATIKRILSVGQQEGVFGRGGAIYRAYERVYGRHMGNQIGDEWAYRREAWSQVVTYKRFLAALPAIRAASSGVVTALRKTSKEGPWFPIDPTFADFHMKIIAHVILGIPVPELPTRNNRWQLCYRQLYQALALMEKQVLLRSLTGIFWPLFVSPGKCYAYFAQRRYVSRTLDPIISSIYAVARDPTAHNTSDDCQTAGAMLFEVAKHPRYTFKDLQADVRAVLFPRTTSHVLSFAMAELARNPRVLENARTVVDTVFGELDPQIHLSQSNISQLSYIEAIFKETIRLHPVVSQIGLVTLKDTTIEGAFVPAGTDVRLQLTGTAHSEAFYDQPTRFRPERWLQNFEAVGCQRSDTMMFGFSMGPHRCIGAPLALLEATVILSILLWHFEWEVASGAGTVDNLDQNITTFCRDGMPLRFTARHM